MSVRRTVRLAPLSRRAVLRGGLRGAGVALALPALEAMGAPALEGPRARRFLAMFAPNGMLPAAWRPTAEGANFELPPTLEPLADVRSSVTVLGNLQNRNSHEGEGHYVKTTSLLSGAKVVRTGGRHLRVGTSLDQELARRFGHVTPIRSLALGVEPVRHRVDMGYSTVYGAHISWTTPTLPAAREIHPRRVYERVVRWSGLRAGGGRQRAVLDLIRREAKSLGQKLGGEDRRKLDEYLTSVEELGRRVEAFADGAGAPVPEGAPTDPAGHDERCRLMVDMTLLAVRMDATRFVTLMLGNAVSGANFSFLDGVEGGHHGLSHHEGKEDKKRQYALINRWHVDRFADLLRGLGAIDEGQGHTALDSTIALFGSGIADGNRHDPRDIPILVGGGVLPGGLHVRQPKPTPLCDLYARVLEEFGVPDATFGDARGSLAGLPRS